MFKYLFNVLVYLALGVWIGSIVFFGAGVASLLFQPDLLLSRTTAGMINSAILGRLGRVEIIAAVLLVGGTLYMAAHYRRWLNWAALAVAVGMLGATAYTNASLYPKMDQLRITIGDFDRLPAEKAEMKAEFDRGHKLYSNLEKGILFGGILVLILHTSALVSAAERGQDMRSTKEAAVVKKSKKERQESKRQEKENLQDKEKPVTAVVAAEPEPMRKAVREPEVKKAVATG